MIHNTVGKPVQGSDFFDRQREVAEIWSRLETDDILLLAPRRVGKTSLMYRLAETSSEQSMQAIYVSVADATTELAFAKKLLGAIAAHPSKEKVLRALKKSPIAKFLGRIRKIGVATVELELKDHADVDWTILGESIIAALSSTGSRWLLMVDEVPIFVLALLRNDETGGRARDFLNCFRTLRQHAETGKRVRWLLAGSIGLDTVARRMNLGDTINDLNLYTDFGAFTRETACELLDQLATSYDMTLAKAVKHRICERMGWLIPYHLQLCFSELREMRPKGAPSLEDVDLAYERLLSPAKKTYFDFWQQRLHEELGAPDDTRAVSILNAVAINDHGATRQTLSGVLSAEIGDPTSRDAQLRYLIDVLLSDGYIVALEERYQFRSSLLRDYWRRNNL